MNSKLQEAVAIFKALGWEKATSDNVLELPIGTAEQKKAALEGLKSGEWQEWRGGNMEWYFDVNPIALAAFAIRVGIDGRRAVSVISRLGNNSEELGMLETVITARGEGFANRFILSACVERYRVLTDAPTRYGRLVVALVHDIPLPVPHNLGYIKDWAASCAPDQRGWGFQDMQINDEKLLQKVKQRFTEHVQMAIEVGVDVTGPMKDLLKWGINQNCISQAELCAFAFAALNTPIRPGARKVWLEILDFLQVSDDELCLHLEELLPVLSMGESAVINRLAPLYIANASDELLVPLLMSCFSCKVGKTRQLVLTAALKRKRPPQAEQLEGWLALLCTEADAKSVKLAEKLNAQWKLGAVPEPEDTAVHGYWQPTPPLWTVPEFSLGETSPEALTQLAAQLMGQAAVTHDITTERFLAVANIVAYRDPEEARLSLRGLQDGNGRTSIPWFISHWVKKKPLRSGWDLPGKKPHELLPSRNYVITTHLGEQPCLLSTPSMEDLSVRPDDLLARLKTYREAGVRAQESDLYLAMTRLIPEKLTAEKTAEWQSIDVAILLQSGETMPITAGQAVLEWLQNPLPEPTVELIENKYWLRASKFRDAPEFPERLSGRNLWHGNELFAIFPLWGDAALMEIVRWDYEVNHCQGLDLRQAARHSVPFSADVMLNFLAAQRIIHAQDAAEDSHLAVIEAWQRGLLRPGPVDIRKYDWIAGTPDLLSAFAAYLDEISQQGLLSLVWSVTDALILASCKAPRMFSGTADLAELIRRYLPEAVEAVNAGIADASVLNLPGTRMLAARKGSSAAVRAAKAAVESLPPLSQTAPVDGKGHNAALNTALGTVLNAALGTAHDAALDTSPDATLDTALDTALGTALNAALDPPFDSLWPKPDVPCEVPDDGSSVEAHLFQSSIQSKKFLYFVISLPDQPDCVYQCAPGGWTYGLSSEGQCGAYRTRPGAPWPGRDGEHVWLHWDAEAQKTIACTNRNWRQNKESPLSGGRTALPFSLIVVSIGLLGEGIWHSYRTPDLLKELAAHRELDVGVMLRAIKMLLKSPELSPALLVRALEQDASLLPVMWPILTESIRFAGQETVKNGKPPVWVNRILDVAIRNAGYLRQANKCGYIPSSDAGWDGISEIATCKAKSVAIAKAKQLAGLLS